MTFQIGNLKFNCNIYKILLLIHALAFTLLITANEIQAACLLKDTIFKDQKGEVARISNIKECFGWYNKDEPDLSADGTCYLAHDAQMKVDEQAKQYNTRLIGQRLFNLEYKKHIYVIEEDVTVGVPWLHYSVSELNSNDNTSDYKANENETQLMSQDDILDFTLNSDISKTDAKKYYNKLLGVRFLKSGCSNEQQLSDNSNISGLKNTKEVNSNKFIKEGEIIELKGRLKYRSNWRADSLVPYVLEIEKPIEISGVDELCGTNSTKIEKIELFDRREELYKQYIGKDILLKGKIDCPRGAFVLRDFSISEAQQENINKLPQNEPNVQTKKSYDFCYKDTNPNYILDDPTYCLAYVEEYGELTGLFKDDEKKGFESLKPLFPVFSEQCNSEWAKSSDEKMKQGKTTAKMNLAMILNHSVSANNFKENIDHCLRTITFYGEVIRKVNKLQ